MPLVLTCSCGHRWEYDGSTFSSPAPWHVPCPACALLVTITSLQEEMFELSSAPRQVEQSTAPVAVERFAFPVEVPGYDLIEEIKEGGMGVVWKARQRQLNRVVALKMIAAGRGPTSHELLRFRREAEAVARLDHPHIVRVYDFGEHEGRPYFSMEFVDGGTLADRLAGPALPPAEAAALVALLARAMHYAHQQGVIHRDLKPSNVLLSRAVQQRGNAESSDSPTHRLIGWPTPKIADFGLAKVRDETAVLTITGAVMGTASYMPPEQAEGQAHAVGPWSDVWSLGAILYECLTGRPPFKGATRQLTIIAVVTEDPVLPTRLRPEIPANLEAVCLKCLEKSPERRYASAHDLADDLKRFLHGEPLSVQPETEWDREVRWARRAGYELMELIGCTSLGLVYKARHLKLNRLVALKTISARVRPEPQVPEDVVAPARQEEAGMERFRAEAEIAARLQHPNIAQIYDFGECQGRSYFSLEYVDGGTLADRCLGEPRRPEEAAILMQTLAAAVDSAHREGIVHCDLRPFNVLLTATGAPKIAGFGLGRLLAKGLVEVRGRKPGRGFSNYLAPEQAAGRYEAIGPATDVHALGAMFYEMLCGRPPFLASTVKETLARVLCDEPVPTTTLHADVPRRLEGICRKCLQKDPRERYGTARELADDLHRWLMRQKTQTDEFDLVPGYELLHELDRDGMDVIYEARHLALDRVVALKLFRDRLARVQTAVRAVARLSHPNLAQVYDCGEREEVLFVAEELIRGPRLDQHARTPQPPREAAALVETLARAAHYAHRHGIVHRNLKPRVVLLAPDPSPTAEGSPEGRSWGTPKISSFDLAILTNQDAPTEEEGTVVGTPAYMAPEQARGQVHRIGPATDVHALGIILYELLTGTPPFRAALPQELLEQVLLLDPVPPGRLQPRVPRPLEFICLKCLRKDPAERYGSAGDLAEDLRRFLAGRRLQHEKPGLWGRLFGWFLRRPPSATGKHEA